MPEASDESQEPEAEGVVEDTTDQLDAFEREAADEGKEGEYIPGGESGAADEGPEASTVEVCKTVLQVGFNIAAVRGGPHWALEDQEAQDLAEATAAVLEKYLPEGVELGCEAQLIIVVGMVVLPRVAITRAQKAQAEEEEAQQAEGEGEGQAA